MTAREVIARLSKLRNQKNIDGMARFGIVSKKAFGISAPRLRELAQEIGKDHSLAIGLWKTRWYEARMLAAFIADPERLTRSIMNTWAKDFDNWAITDGVCIHLFRKTPFAHTMAKTWTRRKEEFVRRAGFTMMATLAVHDKKAPDSAFEKYLPIIAHTAADDRNGVKKAVNWALRQIGKRNKRLYRSAYSVARQLSDQASTSARWIGNDALREFRNPAILRRLKARNG